jgi:hypothetical protein
MGLLRSFTRSFESVAYLQFTVPVVVVGDRHSASGSSPTAGGQIGHAGKPEGLRVCPASRKIEGTLGDTN